MANTFLEFQHVSCAIIYVYLARQVTESSFSNFVWDFSLSKLYVNALISTLNARTSWGNLIVDSSTSPSSRLMASRVPDVRRFTHATCELLTTHVDARTCVWANDRFTFMAA